MRKAPASYIGNGDRLHDRRKQVNEDNESHGEAAETAEPVQEYKFRKIVDRGVDPATTLGQQDFPFIRSNCVGVSVSNKLRFVIREVLEQ